MPQANSTTSSPRLTSPSASAATLPCSRVRISAISFLCFSTSSRNANRTRVRVRERGLAPGLGRLRGRGDRRVHDRGVAKATCACCSPVAGFITAPQRSTGPSQLLPPIQCRTLRQGLYRRATPFPPC